MSNDKNNNTPASAAPSQGAPVGDKPAPKKMSPMQRIILEVAVIVGLIAGAIYFILFVMPFEDTDDAQIDGHIVSMAPQVAGQVKRLLVTDNQEVKAGDLLVEIDPSDYNARLASAKANLAAAKAEADYASADLKRYQTMGNLGVSQSQIDLAAEKAASAQAQVDVMQAAVDQAQLNLSYTKVTAPQDGRVTRRTVEQGAYIQTGQPLMAIVPHDLWVTANFKETQLAHMRIGQPVEIVVDAFPGHSFKGHVDSIQTGTGASFSLFPPENATGNYIKVVQRVPVKIVFDSPPDSNIVLGPGMSVEPKVRVK